MRRFAAEMMTFGNSYGFEIVRRLLRTNIDNAGDRESQIYVIVNASKTLAYEDCFTTQNVYGDDVVITLPLPEALMQKHAIICIYQCGLSQVRIVSPNDRVKLEWTPGQSQPITRGKHSNICLHRRSPHLWRMRSEFEE